MAGTDSSRGPRLHCPKATAPQMGHSLLVLLCDGDLTDSDEDLR